MRKLSLIALALFGFASMAQAEVFAVNGGSITATKQGNDVTVTVEGIPATKLVHFRGQGDKAGFIHSADMVGNKGVLENVDKNGGRLQLRDASGKWLLVTPTGNPYKMIGVAPECKKSNKGCALEVTLK